MILITNFCIWTEADKLCEIDSSSFLSLCIVHVVNQLQCGRIQLKREGGGGNVKIISGGPHAEVANPNKEVLGELM